LLELDHRLDVLRERVIAVAEVAERVAEPAAGVGHEVPYRRARGRGLVLQLERRDVAAYRRREIELALLDESHDHRRSDRLRDRGDLEERVAIHVKRMVDVGHTPACELLLAVVPDADGDAGHVIRGHAVTDERIEAGIHALKRTQSHDRARGLTAASFR